MAAEPNQQASEAIEQANENQNHNSEASTDEILKTKVDRDSVVDFIEGMVHALGSAAAGQLPQQRQVHPRNMDQGRKYQSKAVAAIMQKLERVQKYPDLAKEVQDDPVVLEWLNRSGCKQKEYFDELECAQELTGFYGGYRRFDLAIKAASKALNITNLHRREDDETMAELNWVLADLHAASDKMDIAMEYLDKCLALVEPGADHSHPTYNELLSELRETNQRSRMLAPA